MASRRVRLFLSGAGTGLVLLTIATTSNWFKGVAVADATIADDNPGGSPKQSSNATPDKSTSSGRASQARSKGAASTRKPESEPEAEKLPPPPETWQEHWSEHHDLVKLVASNDDVAIYFDDAMPRRGIAWMVPFVTKAWQYTKKTYGNFGPDPRLFAIFHQGKYNGGHPSTYFDDSHDHRNVSDCGLSCRFAGHEDSLRWQACPLGYRPGIARLLLLAGLAEALGAFDSHFVTVNLGRLCGTIKGIGIQRL